MDNLSVSKIFADVAVLMQAKGENAFKIRAYSRASGAIENLLFQITDIIDDTERLGLIPGFGKAIIEKTQELVRTGRLGLLDRLNEEVPTGVLELTQIPGIGPKTAMAAATELGISSFEQLAVSIESGEFESLPRISAKLSKAILRHTLMRLDNGDRVGLGRARKAAVQIIQEIQGRCPDVEHLEVVGSIRRGSELVGDINILAQSEDAASVIDAFTTLSNCREVVVHEDSTARFSDRTGLEFSIDVVPAAAFAGALVHSTGSVAHVTTLEQVALEAGLSFRSNGLFVDETSELVSLQSEKEVYERLGLNFIPAEMREGSAETGRSLSTDFHGVLKYDDIRGDLHSHTDWSDGLYSMEEMIAAAEEQGLEYLAITDHSASATVANGLKPDRLIEHSNLVRSLDSSTSSIRLLSGTEMDIKLDGSLDYTDDLLAGLDIVNASIHSGMDQDEKTMTSRIVSAMRNPHVDVICHLTTRLIERRAPVMVDVDTIFNTAVATGTVLEINASPERLDLNADLVRKAVDMGVIFVINTDSHRTPQFENMMFGVQTAIRGCVKSNRVINTLPFLEMKTFLELPKSERYEFRFSRD